MKHCFAIFVLIFLIVVPPNKIYAGIWDILSPTALLQHLIEKLPVEKKQTRVTPPTPTVPTKLVKPEETVFNLAPTLQSFFNSGDQLAKEEFVISPLSIMIMLGQIMIGMHGWHEQIIESILGLKREIVKRQIVIIKETHDSLYDEEIHHGAFHFKLMSLVRNALSNEVDDKVTLSYVMFHRKDIQFVEHFERNMNKAYRPALEIIPLDFADTVSSTDVINQWGTKNGEPDLANHLTELINPHTDTFLLHILTFKCMWKTPLERTLKPEDFFVTPYHKTQVKYLQGIVRNTLYVDFKDFTLACIPLNHADTNVYILLPKGTEYTAYDIRGFSERLTSEYLKDAVEKHQELKHINLKIPDVFSQFVSFDVMKPLSNYINDVNERKGKSDTDEIALELNGAAANVKINHLVQHLYLSITSEHEKKFPETDRVENPQPSAIEITTEVLHDISPSIPTQSDTTFGTPVTTQTQTHSISTKRPPERFRFSTAAPMPPPKSPPVMHPTKSDPYSNPELVVTNAPPQPKKKVYEEDISNNLPSYSTENNFVPNSEKNKYPSNYPHNYPSHPITNNVVYNYEENKQLSTYPQYGNPQNALPKEYYVVNNPAVINVGNAGPYQYPIANNPSSPMSDTVKKIESDYYEISEGQFQQYPAVNNPAIGAVSISNPVIVSPPYNNVQNPAPLIYPGINNLQNELSLQYPMSSNQPNLGFTNPVYFPIGVMPPRADTASVLNNGMIPPNNQFNYGLTNTYPSKKPAYPAERTVSDWINADNPAFNKAKNIKNNSRRKSPFQQRTKRESVVDFEVTRPFVFIIMKPTTKMVLVWGSISHPEKINYL